MSWFQGIFTINDCKQIIINNQIPVEAVTGWQQSEENWQKPFCQKLNSITHVLYFQLVKNTDTQPCLHAHKDLKYC